MLSVFLRQVFLGTSLCFLQSSVRLSFFAEGFRDGRWGGGEDFVNPEQPLFLSPESGDATVLPVLALVLKFFFCYGSLFGRFWGMSSVICGGLFWMVWFWRLCGSLYRSKGEIFRRFRWTMPGNGGCHANYDGCSQR